MAFRRDRILYDDSWLQADCPGDPPSGTTTDNTVGTYVTNYVVLGIGLVACGLTLSSTAVGWQKGLTIAFFVFTGLGYGVAGLMHQFFYDDESVIGRISYSLVTLGTGALQALSAHLFCQMYSAVREQKVIGIILFVYGLIVIAVLITKSAIIVLATKLLALIAALVVWSARASKRLQGLGWLKAGASALMLGSIAIQLGLRGVCGDGGYPDCFRSCPLPAPHFNHNALYHIVYAFALAVLGVAIMIEPDKPCQKIEVESSTPPSGCQDLNGTVVGSAES